MYDVHKSLLIAAPVDKVWAALVEVKSICAWMDDDSIAVDLRVGGEYAFFGHETTGAFTEIDAPHHLVYTWRQSGWNEAWPDSLVSWSLAPSGTGTRLSLLHTQFPNNNEGHDHDEGWDLYWLGPMKDWLETGE